MDGDEEARAAELAPSVEKKRGRTPANCLVRATSSLAGAAISITIWEVQTALRVATLATDLAVRASAELASRAGRALGQPADVHRGLSEEVNRALVLRLHRAMVEADLATTGKLFAEGIRWRVPGPGPMAGEYRGAAAAASALASIWRQMGRVRGVELRDVAASPERAAALLRLSVVRGGRPATLDRWVILRIDGGEVTEAWGPFGVEPDVAETFADDEDPDDARVRERER